MNDWGMVEAGLGLRLPSDYKELMDRYASLTLDAFLGLFIPNPGDYPGELMHDSILGLLDDVAPDGDEEQEVVDDDGNIVERRHFSHYPTPGGIIPWGSTQNGQLCLWEADGDPDSWKVLVSSDGAFMWKHGGGILDFLIQANRGQLRCPLMNNKGNLDRTFDDNLPGQASM
ncbi:SMI1/KNR4 family protein [Nonomuraea sp. NPDC050680]|uniref:SMI1/KNR4 family protein n=1 Tax=Nonomuraea sp. NPDC050680 TaxID=3154630 RepID=UPI0033F48C6D